MSVRIRLRRVGRKKQPYYRVVVAQSTAPRDGAYIDELGFYNPRTRPAFLTMDLEKVDSWIEKGAEVTESAASLIRKARKGGDGDITFVRPGEEAPRLKTATKPERRPTSQGVEAEEAKAEEPKAEEAKAEEPKAEEAKAEEPKAEEPKAEEPKAEEPKAEEPKAEKAKAKAKAEKPKAEAEEAEASEDEAEEK